MIRPTIPLVCLWTLWTLSAVAAQTADPEASIEAGRRALHRGGLYPWYDPATDDVHPLPASDSDDDDPSSDSGLPSEMDKESGSPGGWGSGSDSHSDWGSDGDSSSWRPTLPNLPTLPGFQVIAWLLVAAALLAVTYVVVWAFWSLIPGRRAVRDDDDSDDQDRRRRRDALPTVARFQAGLLDEARRRYEAADFDNAIVYLFCHQLVQLDRHDRIRLTPGKTNRQYLRELDPQTDLRKILQQSMSTFEDAFFGHRAIDRTRFESCWNRLQEFETLAAGRAA